MNAPIGKGGKSVEKKWMGGPQSRGEGDYD